METISVDQKHSKPRFGSGPRGMRDLSSFNPEMPFP
jgi:hypothetical protein